MSPTDRLPIARALISVSDKTGVVALGKALAAHGIEILSTGGSAAILRDANIPVREVADFTGFPEILDGRVKTLVPQIHGGILARRDDETHVAQMQAHGLGPIDLVCVNLYPFQETVARKADDATCIENIDIGGPTLIRSAAKNAQYVAVLTEPAQYAELVDALAQGGPLLQQRKKWAKQAFTLTAGYDAAIAEWFCERDANDFPAQMVITATCKEILRYGENPHQKAAFYVTTSQRAGVASAQQVQGKALSYNNLNDTDAAFELVAEFSQPAVVIVKHANPCGVALGDTLVEAWDRALCCDPVSAFGGIVAVNRTLDAKIAARIRDLFIEVVIAPDADDDARSILGQKKALRLLLTKEMPDPLSKGRVIRSLAGGFLVQSRDNGQTTKEGLRVVTKRRPTDAQLDDLIFAFRVAKHVKSNAIVFAKGYATVGIGAGQMSRVDSTVIATRKGDDAARKMGKSEPLTHGAVAASDAFFPFADGLEQIVAAGAVAVIQPGGSLRDEEVIDAADRAGIAMVFTGMRHFRH